MSQQINLLNNLPKGPRYNLSQNGIFLVLGGYLAFLLMLTIVQTVMLGWGKYSLVQLQKSYDEHQIELNKNTILASLNNTTQLESQLSEKQALLQTLESKKANTGQCAFLSYYFETFAQSIIPGLWLTKINIDLSHDEMVLTGNTYVSTLPISFIQAIEKNQCFTDRQYGPIELIRSEPTAPATSGGTPTAENSLPKMPANSKEKLTLLGFSFKSSPGTIS